MLLNVESAQVEELSETAQDEHLTIDIPERSILSDLVWLGSKRMCGPNLFHVQ
jgi:hypothetical protein